MNEQQNVQVIQQMYAVIEQGRPPVDFYAEDIEFYVAGSREKIPFAGTHYGQEQVAQLLAQLASILFEVMDLQQAQLQDFIAQGNQVVVIGSYVWRVRSNNHLVKYDWVHVFTMHNGKIRKIRGYFDTATYADILAMLKIDSVPKLAS